MRVLARAEGHAGLLAPPAVHGQGSSVGAAGEAQPQLPVLLSRRHQGDALHGGTFRNVCYDRDHPTPSAGTYRGSECSGCREQTKALLSVGCRGQKQADGGGRGAGDPPGVRADGWSGASARTEVSVTRAQQRVDGWGACARTARAQWALHLRASRVEGNGSGLESEAGEGRAGRCGRSS